MAGWLEAKGPGMYMLRWDGAAAERGVVWVTATAAGSPPDVLDGLALLEECLLPPLRRHTLLAIQVGSSGGACRHCGLSSVCGGS